MRSRRFLLIALLAVGGLVLAACGDDSDSSSSDTTAATTTTEATTETTAAASEAPEPIDTAPYTLVATPGTDLSDGDMVTVEVGGFEPGAELTVVTCHVFPAVGPESCDLATYGEYTGIADDTGAATIDFVVASGELDGGTCDHTTNCFILVGDGFGADANYAVQEVTYAAG
ncbi:MAG: neocarzinostatin apoprotein domain-containing protein [Actinomycetota bacterium]